MDIGKNAIARRAIGWWQMDNVMDNHSNIERNIGGGSARNFNQEKCASNGQIHWAYCLWETGKGSALRG